MEESMLRTRRDAKGEWEFYDPADDHLGKSDATCDEVRKKAEESKTWDRPKVKGRVGTWRV
jgi:hypothetical protein